MFNEGGDSTETFEDKSQALLNAWHEVLAIEGGGLKLSKCYWNLQCYKWKGDRCTHNVDTNLKLSIEGVDARRKIEQLK